MLVSATPIAAYGFIDIGARIAGCKVNAYKLANCKLRLYLLGCDCFTLRYAIVPVPVENFYCIRYIIPIYLQINKKNFFFVFDCRETV